MSAYPTKIVLATDGSEDAALAARVAVDLGSVSMKVLHAACRPVLIYRQG